MAAVLTITTLGKALIIKSSNIYQETKDQKAKGVA